ncbi:MAG: ABC transporter ATP-binding protein [bacterium]|nr:ABC transporter ATP-binding protein [bacterium]
MISIEGLNKSFKSWAGLKKKQVLNKINLKVSEGETFALIGPNGAGKSTLIKCLIGYIRFDSGDVSVLNEHPFNSKTAERIGYLPELPNMPDFMTGSEYFRVYHEINNSKITSAKIKTWLEKVDLTDDIKTKIKKYSKGMKQRLAIASVFSRDCDLYFLDEPILGLDPIGVKMVRDFIKDKHKEGKTVFINSHILSEVEKTVDRISVLKGGSLILDKKMSDLKGNYIKIRFKIIDDSLKVFLREKYSNVSIISENEIRINNVKDDSLPSIIREFSSQFDLLEVIEEKETLENLFMEYIGKNEGTI